MEINQDSLERSKAALTFDLSTLSPQDQESIETSFQSFFESYKRYALYPEQDLSLQNPQNPFENFKECQAELLEREERLFRRVLNYAVYAHKDQRRATGEPYILHPIAVAKILTELEVDKETLIAAFLHDVVEDTDITYDQLKDDFSVEVADLVDGVTKLAKMSFSSKEEQQAENFRKMFLAMAKDIRVVLIKLADRLHNMRTLKYVREEKQERISRETLDIYAPLAHRLGIYKWKWELEDSCLRYLDKTAYYELVGAIAQRREEREQHLEELILAMKTHVKEMGITADIEGRPKHFYSIYKKMKAKGKVLDQIYDLFACRVIVNTVADCYAVLGLVHEMFRPMPGRFKDYIAMPKPNMYQSLHTTVIAPTGLPFEVQIRTLAMHRIAEFGIAAHYHYKETGQSQIKKKDKTDDRLSWLRQLLDWQKDMKDADEFMENLKSGLVEDEVFVFTPRGDVVSLPVNATPIDFAYYIHSNVGNHMYGVKINGRIAPLTQELSNGDIIEVLTSDKVQGPSRDWLKVVKSSSARSKINQWFKRETREENIARGKEIFEREIKKIGFSYQELCQESFLQKMLQKNHFQNMDDFYAAVGYGNFSASKAIPKLRDAYLANLSDGELFKLGYRKGKNGKVIYDPEFAVQTDSTGQVLSSQPAKSKQKNKHKTSDFGIVVKGLNNCLVRLSQCCHPVFGDNIIGYISRGNGVAVHRKDCPNIRNLLSALAENQMDKVAKDKVNRLIECSWGEEQQQALYPVKFKIISHDRPHLLSEITNAIAEEKVSIVSGQMETVKGITASMTLTVEISSQIQADRLQGRIKAIRDVQEVLRV